MHGSNWIPFVLVIGISAAAALRFLEFLMSSALDWRLRSGVGGQRLGADAPKLTLSGLHAHFHWVKWVKSPAYRSLSDPLVATLVYALRGLYLVSAIVIGMVLLGFALALAMQLRSHR